ncbi:TonB-dependent receptor [Pedobacter sp. Hv1]|uniref:TonB-dependent receptor n=1 Tax=Pedobacter sp. Hv1 TaxID=1740090 RepID=UPI0006D8D126|nr:TonB-dependent receptor [Pedobacter sp. Hv1]KQB99459.1 TonB-dependent receptor [Pedobacter sp. Hv1]
MRKKLAILIFSLISSISLSAFVTDDDPFTALLKKLAEYTKKYPQEKVYLHLDKPYYGIGDNIWFKAYVVDSRTSEPTTTSNILYVELINDRDSLQKQLKLPMQAGITWGDFKLPDSLSEGNYRIRAYTQYMRNAGPDFFFDKTIKIGNALTNKVFTQTSYQYTTENNVEKVNSKILFSDKNGKAFANTEIGYNVELNDKNVFKGKGLTNANGEINIAFLNTQPSLVKSGRIIASILVDGQKITKFIPIKTTAKAIDVQFFPESGSLIADLPAKIAIKVVNSNGLGENVSGTIIDNDGAEVLAFETTHLGMGSFSLTPAATKTYSAKVKMVDGTEKTIQLPKLEKSGYLLTVNNADSLKMGIKVLLTADLLNKGELNLVAQHNGNVYFTTKVPTGKQIAAVTIPKNELPSGIIQLTLFSPENIPVAERLTFVNNVNDKIALEIQHLKPSYGKREKAALTLLASNQAKPLQGSFSVSVTNASVVTPDPENESNILTGLLLTSDLVGYVEKPNYYFLNNDVKARAALDNLLLTQGWRKIDWKAIDNAQLPAINFPAEKSMKVSGTITNGGKPVVKGKVSLFSSSSGIFATDTLTDANGRFDFDKIAFKDSTRFTIKAVTSKDNKNVRIKMDDALPQAITINKNFGDIEPNINVAIKEYLIKSNDFFEEQSNKGFLSRTNMLKQVEVVKKVNKAPNSSNLNGGGNADAVFSADELEKTPSLTHFLQGRVAGIQLYNGAFYLTKNNPGMTLPLTVNAPQPMMVIVDGVNLNLGEEKLPEDKSPSASIDDITLLDIESVEILKSVGTTAAYGTSNGVIVITTKTGKGRSDFNRYAPGMLSYAPKGFYVNRQFYSPKYDVKPDNKPDLRTTVFWDPHLISDVNGKIQLDYFNTDQVGNYRIVIEGIDAVGNLARKVFTYKIN